MLILIKFNIERGLTLIKFNIKHSKFILNSLFNDIITLLFPIFLLLNIKYDIISKIIFMCIEIICTIYSFIRTISSIIHSFIYIYIYLNFNFISLLLQLFIYF